MRFILALALAVFAYAADPREAEVMTAQEAFVKCWDARDVACLSKIVTDDFILINRFEVLDRKAFMTSMRGDSLPRTDPDYRLKTRDLKLRFYGTAAIRTEITNTPILVGARGTPNRPTVEIDLFRTAVWVNLDGKSWRLASMHISLPQGAIPPSK